MIDRPHARPGARRTLRALVPLATLSMVLAACFRVGTLPARELYRLAPADSLMQRLAPAGDPDAGSGETGASSPRSGRAVLAGTLAVLPYITPGLYGDRGIVFRKGENEYGVYPNREWALPLGEMLGQQSAELARGRGLVMDAPLYDPPAAQSQTYRWRGTVREFEEVDRGTSVYAAVRLDAMIVRAVDDSVVWSGTLAAERLVARPTMPEIVSSLSGLAAELVVALVLQAERELGARGPVAPPPRAP